MSNWTIKGGSNIVYFPNSIGYYTVPNTSDDEVAGNVRYVARWGNDSIGNGSRNQPYATLQRVLDDGSAKLAVFESGTYYEQFLEHTASLSIHVIGDGEVIFDGSKMPTVIDDGQPRQINYFIKNTGSITNDILGLTLNNIIFKNYKDSIIDGFGQNNSNEPSAFLYNSKILNVNRIFAEPAGGSYASIDNPVRTSLIAHNSIFYNIRSPFWIYNDTQNISNQSFIDIIGGEWPHQNNTYINCAGVFIKWSQSVNTGYIRDCLFQNCNILFRGGNNTTFGYSTNNSIDYCYFYHCNFTFFGSTGVTYGNLSDIDGKLPFNENDPWWDDLTTGLPTTFSPAFSNLTNISTIKSQFEAKYTSNTTDLNLSNSYADETGDPGLNDPSLLNFSLSTGANASDKGVYQTHIGARGVGKSVNADGTALGGTTTGTADFPIKTTNVVISGGSASTNDGNAGSLTSVVFDLGKYQEIEKIDFNGVVGFLSEKYFTTKDGLSNSTQAIGPTGSPTTLAINKTWRVELGGSDLEMYFDKEGTVVELNDGDFFRTYNNLESFTLTNPPVSSYVTTVVELKNTTAYANAGDIIIAGNFDTIAAKAVSSGVFGTSKLIVRLDANGELQDMIGGTDGLIYDIVELDNGSLIVAGEFTQFVQGTDGFETESNTGLLTVGGIPGVLKINTDGSIDQTFNTNLNSVITRSGLTTLFQSVQWTLAGRKFDRLTYIPSTVYGNEKVVIWGDALASNIGDNTNWDYALMIKASDGTCEGPNGFPVNPTPSSEHTWNENTGISGLNFAHHTHAELDPTTNEIIFITKQCFLYKIGTDGNKVNGPHSGGAWSPIFSNNSSNNDRDSNFVLQKDYFGAGQHRIVIMAALDNTTDEYFPKLNEIGNNKIAPNCWAVDITTGDLDIPFLNTVGYGFGDNTNYKNQSTMPTGNWWTMMTGADVTGNPTDYDIYFVLVKDSSGAWFNYNGEYPFVNSSLFGDAVYPDLSNRQFFGRIKSTGALDKTFPSGNLTKTFGILGGDSTGQNVYDMIITSTGKFILGGVFNYYDGDDTVDFLIRLSLNGELDKTFRAGSTEITGGTASNIWTEFGDSVVREVTETPLHNKYKMRVSEELFLEGAAENNTPTEPTFFTYNNSIDKPKVNRNGDYFWSPITHGDGDDNYDPNNSTPIRARYVQFKVDISASTNLPESE
jgi:hypothetical protein